MLKLLEKIIWLICIAALGFAGYYGYTWWYESTSSVSDYQRALDGKEVDEVTKEAIETGVIIKKEKLDKVKLNPKSERENKNPKKCEKIFELYSWQLKKVFPVFYAPNLQSEDACLKKGASLIHRNGMAAYPGEEGVVVISGHRDTTFRDFKNIKKGYTFTLYDKKTQWHFQITNHRTKPKDASKLIDPLPKPGEFRFELSTCFPFEFTGDAPYRRHYRSQLTGVTKNPEKWKWVHKI